MSACVLQRVFYLGPATTVAERLIGKVLVCCTPEGMASGIIVETEAYPPDDPANHAFRGKTRRNAPMFGEGGRAYVYQVHTHLCFNVVTGFAGVPAAVLIRAIQPLDGIDVMRRRRGVETGQLLAAGPGRLTQALGITLAHNGVDVTDPCESGLYVEDRGLPPFQICRSGRVGVSAAKDLQYRYYVAGSPYVSKHTG